MEQFFLGTHRPSWLGRVDVPLFVSRRTMPSKSLRPALAPWALDSGGFSELSMYGAWTVTTATYVDEVHRFSDHIGSLAWVAPMDWMCEPGIVASTGLSIARHQELTIDNFVTLRSQLGGLVVPVLQGWDLGDYLDHAADYLSRGIDLWAEPVIGVGTICRRQGTYEAETILRDLSGMGLRLHAFGAKITGLARYHDALVSSDSMAWSYNARKNDPLPGHAHKNCANCIDWALRWRKRLLDTLT